MEQGIASEVEKIVETSFLNKKGGMKTCRETKVSFIKEQEM
ncbi:hypothetical protein BAT_1644 [Bacillus pumilus ATCC 7061]|nr:hypothetical protein BAT_1644 [Bacillus pumilus ATCC 7061]